MAFRTCSSLKKNKIGLLPEEMLILIFTYLPLCSIYKFRCVSKVWLSILSNPNFITKWIQFHTIRRSLPWIQCHSVNSREQANPLKRMHRIAYPDLHSHLLSRYEHAFLFRFLNSKPFKGDLHLLASSNGLVLCYLVNLANQRSFHVCNPLTQKWVSIPSPPKYSPTDTNNLRCVIGFLCEYPSSQILSCFKIVRIPVFTASRKFSVHIFSSDLGEWEILQVSCPQNVTWCPPVSGVVIHEGVLFWIEGEDRLLAYNFNNNITDGHHCCLINLPIDYNGYISNKDHILAESEGLVCYARISRSQRNLSVWVLEEEHTWQLLQNDIELRDILGEMDIRLKNTRSSRCSIMQIQILAFNPVDRNVVLLGCRSYVWSFNIQTRRFEELCYPSVLAGNHFGDGFIMWRPFVLKPMPTILPQPSWMDT